MKGKLKMFNYNPKTIYKDLIKLVHPDINRNMPDATHRAQQVNVCKNNPDMLRRLAVAWGLMKNTVVTPNTNQNTTNQNTGRTYFSAFNVNPTSLYDMDFTPGMNYANRGFQIRIKIKNRHYVCRVIRTTKKCVVVDFGGQEKIVRMNNIVRREA
jgi:hypothetical protein